MEGVRNVQKKRGYEEFLVNEGGVSIAQKMS